MKGKLLFKVLYSNFNYCPLVWYFSSAKSLEKIEKIQERALRYLYNDHLSSYSELLEKSERSTMHVSHLRVLCIDIFKTLVQLNPSFMSDIFKIKSSRYLSQNPYNLQHHRPNQVTGSNGLQLLGPQSGTHCRRI